MAKAVLVVEDDESMQELYDAFFKIHKDEFSYHHASTAEIALTVLSENRIDAVVLDCGLPGMSGLDLLKKIRSNKSLGDPAVFMVTAKDTLEDCVLGLNAGADDYLSKPFEEEELLARLRCLLRRR
ncbi:MAG: response regulator [Elusimicrobia bacterium]|nr:response regulator [Elusimicrobiota bacterium]